VAGVLATADLVQGVFLLAVIVLGYVVCFALWWFCFRGRGDH
jgi:hypothetical protein